MELKQSQKLTQKLALTPQMKQSLYILQLPIMELKNYLEKQLEENPVLEKEEVESEYPLNEWEEKTENILQYTKEICEPHLNSSPDKERSYEYKQGLIVQPLTLEETLLKQLRTLPISDKKYRIGEYIITHLDENGYLTVSDKELLNELNKNVGEEKVTQQDIKEVLEIIHKFEPYGIGARNLKESLLIQLKCKNKANTLAYKILSSYLPELLKNKTKFIAKKLKVSQEELNKAIKEISLLHPKPAKALPTSITKGVTLYNYPDIILDNTNGSYEIILNTRSLPRIKINDYYLKLLKSNKVSSSIKKYIQEKINSALGLIKAISQRDETILKIAQHIVKIQKKFLESGDSALFKPLSLKDIAKITNHNESTISRVVNSKYIQTSYGTFKLSYFFTKSLKTKNGEKISQELVKSEIWDIISEEDKNKPLRDKDIVQILKNRGIEIARRTVTKYREELKIPPYHQRKNNN
ncbi:MAG: RNA polymerase factor sigma-54 [Candidatus Omnitrophica bacterium]|nr:RNA polymerase factor sigma-54 [Candidatus Omnitrophota bacterium]MCM8826575.1 RNA polymerase factor sigma-54 [Candidatus Omnitrophota bacterium]